MAKILVVDDNQDILDALELLLTLHNYQVVTATDAKSALLAVTRQNIDMVIQDMNFSMGLTSGSEGKSLFSLIRQEKPNLPIVLITAWTQLETAVELVKQGAADYLQKPWDDQKLLQTVEQYTKATEQTATLTDKPRAEFIYRSAEMATLVQDSARVAKADVNVLITGVNGAGKEKLADYIHQESERADKPFIKVNMGAIPQDLMEAELFGAEKGAYTGANQQRTGRFEAADGGILFLDEIGNLSLSGQMKLLRVLQTGEFERLGSSDTIKVNVRVISATNTDLDQAINQGRFREDLYFRLNVVELHILPLKQRKADILPLAEHFIGNKFTLSQDAKDYLLQYDWPGNVRELENRCKRAKVFALDGQITQSTFTGGKKQQALNEKQHIEQVLEQHNGVIKYAAEALGLSRQALYRRIEKYKIEVNK